MRPLLIFPFVSALLLAACSAPQTQDPSAAGAVHQYRLHPAEVDEIIGVYRTDNGLVLRVTNTGRRLFLQIGERPRTEMVPVAEYRFVSADRRITMQYRPVAYADELEVSYPADLDVPSARMVTVRLALER